MNPHSQCCVIWRISPLHGCLWFSLKELLIFHPFKRIAIYVIFHIRVWMKGMTAYWAIVNVLKLIKNEKNFKRVHFSLSVHRSIVKGNRKNKHYISTKGFSSLPPLLLERLQELPRQMPSWQTINNTSALLKNFLLSLFLFFLILGSLQIYFHP